MVALNGAITASASLLAFNDASYSAFAVTSSAAEIKPEEANTSVTTMTGRNLHFASARPIHQQGESAGGGGRNSRAWFRTGVTA